MSVHRINEVLDTEVRMQNGTQERENTGSVEFRHVPFRSPDTGENLQHDISFTAEPGQAVAFIGATGSGKQTGRSAPLLLWRLRRRDPGGRSEYPLGGRNIGINRAGTTTISTRYGLFIRDDKSSVKPIMAISTVYITPKWARIPCRNVRG